jgi:hypothetical protein
LRKACGETWEEEECEAKSWDRRLHKSPAATLRFAAVYHRGKRGNQQTTGKDENPYYELAKAGWRVQRGRGRRGGRAVRARGRMRKRGLRGGGTLRRKSPQQGQRPSSAMGPVASARSQWPRASHIGLMHCTVKPGRYCMRTPSVAASFAAHRTAGAAEAPMGGPDRIVGVDSAVRRLWCQEN